MKRRQGTAQNVYHTVYYGAKITLLRGTATADRDLNEYFGAAVGCGLVKINYF
jgi:hypothetical protein